MGFVLSSASDLPLDESRTARVQDGLESLIMSGELKAGDRINENALAERFDVSRGPIREACRALAQDGLLIAIRNRGMFVRELDLRDALEVYDIRAALDDMAGRSAAERITEDQVTELEGLLDQMDVAAERQDISTYYPLNLTFHNRILEFARNQRLAGIYRSLVKSLHLFRRRGLGQDGSMRISNEEHRQVLDALRRRDPIRAGGAMKTHVLAAKQRLLAACEEQYEREARVTAIDEA